MIYSNANIGSLIKYNDTVYSLSGVTSDNRLELYDFITGKENIAYWYEIEGLSVNYVEDVVLKHLEELQNDIDNHSQLAVVVSAKALQKDIKRSIMTSHMAEQLSKEFDKAYKRKV